MYWIVLIFQAILAGVFGWYVGDLAYKCHYGYIKNFKTWKAFLFEIIFLIVVYTSSWLGYYASIEKTYDTSKYDIVYQQNDDGQMDSTTFKIIKR